MHRTMNKIVISLILLLVGTLASWGQDTRPSKREDLAYLTDQVSEGNADARKVITEILRYADEEDSQGRAGGIAVLVKINENGPRSYGLWRLYEKDCNKNIECVYALYRPNNKLSQADEQEAQYEQLRYDNL